jgi:hypothetical protein
LNTNPKSFLWHCFFIIIIKRYNYKIINLMIMNKFLGIGILALSITACNNGVSKSDSSAIEADLANEIKIKQQQDSLTLDSFRKAESEKALALEQERENQRITKQTSSEQAHSLTNTSNSTPTKTSQKKGWSDAAKGTAIGAGVGAGVGALIDKDKRLRGAAIGAAIGGGSGYAIGRKSDRQSGRVQKK